MFCSVKFVTVVAVVAICTASIQHTKKIAITIVLSLPFGAELQRRTQAMEMRCYRKILRISYKEREQRGSPCHDPEGNRTTRRPPDHRKETQIAVVRTCLPFIRSGQNHLARHSERGKKTRQTEEEVGRQRLRV